MNVSTEEPDSLPGIEEIKRLSQSLAVLDAILQPEWNLRYFSFNAQWRPAEQMASMRDGSGDEYYLVFKPEGAILLALTHESPAGAKVARAGATLPETFARVPGVFADVLAEPAFPTSEITFCLWRLSNDSTWTVGGEAKEEQNHSSEILFAWDGSPETYQEWASDYYEKEIRLETVRHIYQHLPLTDSLVKSLNRQMTRKRLSEDLLEIGYPAPPSH